MKRRRTKRATIPKWIVTFGVFVLLRSIVLKVIKGRTLVVVQTSKTGVQAPWVLIYRCSVYTKCEGYDAPTIFCDGF